MQNGIFVVYSYALPFIGYNLAEIMRIVTQPTNGIILREMCLVMPAIIRSDVLVLICDGRFVVVAPDLTNVSPFVSAPIQRFGMGAITNSQNSNNMLEHKHIIDILPPVRNDDVHRASITCHVPRTTMKPPPNDNNNVNVQGPGTM